MHLGIRGDSQTYRTIAVDYWMKFLLPLIHREQVQVVDILGDFYDNRNHLNVLTNNTGYLLMTLLEQEFPAVQVRLILGNHDIYFRNTREYNSLKFFERFDNVFVIEKIEEFVEDNRSLLYVPWLTDPDELIAYRPRLNKTGKWDIVFGHFEINGFKMNGGFIEDKGISSDVFKHTTSKVFSGHFHKPQEVGNITYVGSTYAMDWDDFDNEKGVYLIDFDTFQHKFIQNHISPRYQKVYLSQLKSKVVNFDAFTGNFVKIYLDTEYTDTLVEKLTEVVKLKNPLSFSIEGFGTKEIDMQFDVNATVESPIETLLAWVETADIGKLDKRVLFDRFKEIYQKVVK